MRIRLIQLFLILMIASCGQDPIGRRIASEGSNVNDFQVPNCSLNSGELCAQPPMPVCPENMACAQVMPAPKTYQSECEMKEEKAQFIQNGACPVVTL